MTFWNKLLTKNSVQNKFIFLLFFTLSFVTETGYRYYYRAELNFSLSKTEIALVVLILLTVLNPKGIRLILLAFFLLLILLSTRSLIVFQLSGVQESLLLMRVLSSLNQNIIMIYVIHLIGYSYFSYISIKNPNKYI